jgi:hypothetical protein
MTNTTSFCSGLTQRLFLPAALLTCPPLERDHRHQKHPPLPFSHGAIGITQDIALKLEQPMNLQPAVFGTMPRHRQVPISKLSLR